MGGEGGRGEAPGKGEERGRLYPTTNQKGVSAFANQIGGYLIIGARWWI